MDPRQQIQRILQQVNRVAMYCYPLEDSATGWNAMAVGDVTVVSNQDERGLTLTLLEVGRSYLPHLARDIAFHNRLQFRFENGHIAFYRYRAAQQFEWLFDLEYCTTQCCFINRVNYHCGSDRYALNIIPLENELMMCWRIIGAAKNEYIEYIYY